MMDITTDNIVLTDTNCNAGNQKQDEIIDTKHNEEEKNNDPFIQEIERKNEKIEKSSRVTPRINGLITET